MYSNNICYTNIIIDILKKTSITSQIFVASYINNNIGVTNISAICNIVSISYLTDNDNKLIPIKCDKNIITDILKHQ